MSKGKYPSHRAGEGRAMATSNGLLMKYFVLNPTKRGEFGKASRSAILEYARVIEKTNRELAEDLRNWVREITDGIVDQVVAEQGRPHDH